MPINNLKSDIYTLIFNEIKMEIKIFVKFLHFSIVKDQMKSFLYRLRALYVEIDISPSKTSTLFLFFFKIFFLFKIFFEFYRF